MCSAFILHFRTLIPKHLQQNEAFLSSIYIKIKILVKSFFPLREDFDCGDGTKDKPLSLVLEMPQVERFLMKESFSTYYTPDLLGVRGQQRGAERTPFLIVYLRGGKKSPWKRNLNCGNNAPEGNSQLSTVWPLAWV